MSEKIRKVLDAVTARVFAYRPPEKAKWAESAKLKPPKEPQDDSKSSGFHAAFGCGSGSVK